jgi:hypothetical protein
MPRRTQPVVVFGQGPLDVLWSKTTHLLLLRCSGEEWAMQPCEGSVHTLLHLFQAHREGRLLEVVRHMFSPIDNPARRFYRVGRLMCFKPYSQEVES